MEQLLNWFLSLLGLESEPSDPGSQTAPVIIHDG